jgi:hypothetical protein
MREVGSSREYLKVFAMCIECPTELERRGGGFYSSQENLTVGVSEIRTCPANLFGTRHGDRICPVRDLATEKLG